MSTFAEPRDRDELEGTLLPVAQAVPAVDNSSSTTVPLVAASATPASYFAYNDAIANNEAAEQQTIQDASAVPLSPPTAHDNSQLLRTQLAHGQRAGAIDNEAQIQDIHRGNRRVHALNYFTSLQVEAANRRAQQLSQAENVAGWAGPQHDLPAANKEGVDTTAQKKKEAPKAEGTFGKEYQVGQYEIKEYDTSDYQISEYKSMYDS